MAGLEVARNSQPLNVNGWVIQCGDNPRVKGQTIDPGRDQRTALCDPHHIGRSARIDDTD